MFQATATLLLVLRKFISIFIFLPFFFCLVLFLEVSEWLFLYWAVVSALPLMQPELPVSEARSERVLSARRTLC